MSYRPTARIDLSVIASNWRALARTGCETGAVVKADAYGHGLAAVARALADAGCRTFFVAHLEEGEALRAVLGNGPAIYVFNGLGNAEWPRFAAAALIPVISSPLQLGTFLGSGDVTTPFSRHFDTGMNRLGIRSGALADTRAALGARRPALVMSHLFASEGASSRFNALQLSRFASIRSAFAAAPASLSNTGGIHLGAAYHFDLTRPGIGLYGGGACPLAPAMTLTARIVSVFCAAPGESVGYGATEVLTRPSRLATLAIGYGDGYLRSLSGRGEVWIGGRACRILGRVSMDLTTVDVTDCVPPPQPGDEAELLGHHMPMETVAARAGSISYELVTGLTSRVLRVYEDAQSFAAAANETAQS